MAEPAIIMGLVQKMPREISVSPNAEIPMITYKTKEKNKVLSNIKFILHEMFLLKK